MVNVKLLAQELLKPEYQDKTNVEILTLLPKSEDKIGRIQDYNKLDLITLIINNGIDDRLTIAKSHENPMIAGLASKLEKALSVDILTKDIYRINLAVPEVKAAFDAALSLELITADEHSKIEQLATYRVNDEFDNVTESDIEQARFIGEQASLKTNYLGNNPFHVRPINKNVRLFIIAENTVTENTNVTITMYGCPDTRDNQDASNFMCNPRTLSVIIPKDTKGAEIVLSAPTTRWLKFDAVADRLIGNFELDVQDA